MSLSDIKFQYEEKIDNVDNRIGRYRDIITHYDERIKKAKEKEIEDCSSLLSSKEQYENKIRNMILVRKYYKEFVDTADYLMQHLNGNDNSQLIIQCEELGNELTSSKNRIRELEQLNFDNEEVIKNLKILLESNQDRLKDARNKNKQNDEKIRYLELEVGSLKTVNQTQKRKMKKETPKRKLNMEIRKLSAENKMLRDTNDFLERRNQGLEDYCNHLLSR